MNRRTHSLLLAGTIAATGAMLGGEREAWSDAAAMIGSATLVMPLRDRDGTAEATGAGLELRFVPDDEAITGSFGGYFAIGQPDGDKRVRDVYDFHFNIGFKPEETEDKIVFPFATLGLDVIVVNTHEKRGTARGTTLGLHAQAGFMGHFGDRWIYRASASYLGAIAPGTGDDLGSLVVQFGIGKRVGD